MYKIANCVHTVWLGSFLTEQDIIRIRVFKERNEHCELKLWISKTKINSYTYQVFQDFCARHHITLCDVETLDSLMSVEVRLWLNKNLAAPIPNYGALKDIYMFYILHRDGGYFCDCDVLPQQSLPTEFCLPLGFAVNALTLPTGSLAIIPDRLAVSSVSQFTHIGIEIIEAMIQTQQLDQFVNAADITDCWIGTESTTGLIIGYACEKILTSNGKGLFTYHNGKPEINQAVALEHLLPQHAFKHQRGLLWLKARLTQGSKIGLMDDRAKREVASNWLTNTVKDIPSREPIRKIEEFIPVQLSLFWTGLRAKVEQNQFGDTIGQTIKTVTAGADFIRNLTI